MGEEKAQAKAEEAWRRESVASLKVGARMLVVPG